MVPVTVFQGQRFSPRGHWERKEQMAASTQRKSHDGGDEEETWKPFQFSFRLNTRAVFKKSIRDPISIHAQKARYRSKNVWIDLFQVTKGTIFFDTQGALQKASAG